MFVLAVAIAFAVALSALAMRKLLRRRTFLGGDLFWIATATYLWFLSSVKGSAMLRRPLTQSVAGMDKTWLLGGGAVLVLLALAYSEANWPPFENSSGARNEWRR